MTDEGVNLLREAIVGRAVNDYKKLVSGKKRHPKYGLYKVDELEEFYIFLVFIVSRYGWQMDYE